MPKFTVLIPTHDHADTLFWSVASVQSQTRQDFELFIVGDGAPERTREVVASLAKQDDRIRFFDNPKGPSRGEIHRHQALQEARGELICYHSDDDLWLPDHLESLESLLADHDLAHTMQIEIHPDRGAPTTWFFNARLASEVEAMRRNETGFGNATAGHTANAYRRLPFGWRAAPPQHNTDLYMWLQFLDQPWCRVASLPRPTMVRFPAQDRKGWTITERCAELAHWFGRVASNEKRVALVRSALEALCTREHSELIRSEQRLFLLTEALEKGQPLAPERIATQVPVTRAVPYYEPGTSLRFGFDGPGEAYLAYGFSTPEDWGVWSSAESAAVVLPLEQELIGDAELLIDYTALLVPESHEQLRVVLSINGSLVDDWNVTFASPSGARKVPIPHACLENAHNVAIHFRLEHPVRPADVGLSPDTRLLGLGLMGLTLQSAA